MGFIKNALLGLLVVSVISLSFLTFTGDLSTYYGGLPNPSNDSYTASVENISKELKTAMNPEDISTSTGTTGLVGDLLTGGKLVANTFSVIVGSMPRLFMVLVTGTSNAVGLPPWAGGIIVTAVGILIITALIWFTLRREL